MPDTVEADGSEDVNDFLQRIKELGDQRDKEDEERTRKLEEEILQGRKERQARRAERARSLSPTKEASTYSGTPGSVRSNNDSSILDDLSKTPSLPALPVSRRLDMDDAPQKPLGGFTRPEHQAAPVSSRELPQPPTKPQPISSTSPSAAMASVRSNTLSWQQRPSSRGSTTNLARSRPLSVLASENSASKTPRPTTESAFEAGDGDVVSRSQITQSLGAKDPTFFKQTQDRGLRSAAYRRNQMDDLSDTSSMAGGMRLSEMPREHTAEPEPRMSSPPESVPSSSPSREGSTRGNNGLGQYNSAASLYVIGGFQSPLPTSSSQRFEPLASENTSSLGGGDSSSIGRTMAMSPSQGRLSPERMDRPSSPTKGLGGFVQSAMMKRSDSVNKRWSAQAGPGLSRGNSVASKDGMRFPVGGVTPLAESRNSSSRENTPGVSSRPTSGHSNASMAQTSTEIQSPSIFFSESRRSEALTNVLGSMSPPDTRTTTPPPTTKPTILEPMMSPPSSPSKRWSPTKSSWLENAISKPDSPKVLSPAASQQPAWMADINRAKQQRGSVDLGKGPAFKEVAVGGLVRSPPPGSGYKPPTIGGLPSGFSSGVAVRPRTGSLDDVQRSGSPVPTRQIDKVSGYHQTTEPSRNSVKTKETAGDSSGSLKPAPVGVTNAPSPATSQQSPQRIMRNTPAVAAKTKPEMPPDMDFRTTLKPLQTSGDSKGKDEPEFKNVFGKLKKTQTQNYVAPDEFKNNILRGKAGLEKTGGPQKSNIKDDFKDSILKKKEGMIAPSASTRITSVSSKNPDTSTPEAIAKRKGLTRSDSTLSNGALAEKKPPPKPEALTNFQSLQEKSESVASDKEISSLTKFQQHPQPKPGLVGSFASSLAGILQRGPSPVGVGGKLPLKSQDDSTPVRSERDQEQAGPQLTHATKARARGPKRKAPTVVKQDAPPSPLAAPEPQIKLSFTEIKPPISTTTQNTQQNQDNSGPLPLSVITNNSNNSDRRGSQPNTPRKSSTTILRPLTSKYSPVTAQATTRDHATRSPPAIGQKPIQSPTISKTAVSAPQAPAAKPVTMIAQSPPERSRELSPPADTQQKPSGVEATHDVPKSQKPLPSVEGAAATWGQSPKPAQTSGPRSPIKLPARQGEEFDMANAGLARKEVIGLGINTLSPVRKSQFSQQGAPTKSTRPFKAPALPGKKPEMVDKNVEVKTPPTKHNALFTEIYEKPPSSQPKFIIDTQSVLDARTDTRRSQKIKTLRKQIFEITQNGKSEPVPSHQEHILFEDSLYLCTHVFGTPAGTRMTEVYLWCGDGVSPSAIEDAQLFAKKVAKESSGRLMILRQGKETSNFFEALGGIVITRQGSRSRSETALYMLCGRQHLGQIAFDEVDFKSQSLCKGFPFIISARGGRLFLWKGAGAGADELGCARLIGMDLGLTGEIDEIDEGKEPAEFWSSFSQGAEKNPTEGSNEAHHWHLKPNCEQYAIKLFEVDVEVPRPKSSSGFMSWGRRGSAPSTEPNGALTAQIKEIAPFSQADLADDHIFVLDAFFEIFVVHPLRTSLTPAPQHRSIKSSTLRAALLFAQDYGILAASAEDRPFVPHSSVVILAKGDGGPRSTGERPVPEALRRAFRKWNGGMAGDCRVIGLAEALAEA